MLTWFRSLFAWDVVKDTGFTVYYQNRITGRRFITQGAGGYQPIDRGWLKTGEWSSRGGPPTRSYGRP